MLSSCSGLFQEFEEGPGIGCLAIHCVVNYLVNLSPVFKRYTPNLSVLCWVFSFLARFSACPGLENDTFLYFGPG